jgi:hypothetical protein
MTLLIYWKIRDNESRQEITCMFVVFRTNGDPTHQLPMGVIVGRMVPQLEDYMLKRSHVHVFIEELSSQG